MSYERISTQLRFDEYKCMTKEGEVSISIDAGTSGGRIPDLRALKHFLDEKVGDADFINIHLTKQNDSYQVMLDKK